MFSPTFASVKPERILHGMAGFMAKQAKAFCVIAPFHFEHLVSLESFESWVSQIEWNRYARDAVRRKPFFR